MSKVQMVSIIDDDACVRDATKDLVSSLDVEVFAFESAEEFLRSPQLEQTSCLITDLHMPGMTGHELQLHLTASGRHIPIIFMTAFPEKTIRQRILNAGAMAFLEKPFDGTTLVNLLRSALDRDCPSTL
ncbi:MAG: response regulator transcription factor [Xanthobacteraceae bacterium]